MRNRPCETSSESGFMLLIAMIASILPLLVVLGASSMTMEGRQSRLDSETDDERTLMAAESGIDYAVYRASTALGLATNTVYTRNLGDGLSFTVTPVFLRTDLVDNDGDGSLDAADPDENIYRVLAVGRYRTGVRRLVAYLGPQPSVPPMFGALSIRSAGQIQVQDSARITGIDTNMNGTAGAGPNQPGLAVELPTSIATATSWIDAADRPRVLGLTAAPSVGQATTAIDFVATRQAIQNSANLILTSASYKNYSFGNGTLGIFKIIYRGGKVTFQGTSRGAGIMFVNGDLQLQEDFRFDGIIYCTGKIQMQGTATIYGAVCANNSAQIQLQVNSKIVYSSQGITQASMTLPGKYVIFNGWQEISRK